MDDREALAAAHAAAAAAIPDLERRHADAADAADAAERAYLRDETDEAWAAVRAARDARDRLELTLAAAREREVAALEAHEDAARRALEAKLADALARAHHGALEPVLAPALAELARLDALMIAQAERVNEAVAAQAAACVEADALARELGREPPALRALHVGDALFHVNTALGRARRGALPRALVVDRDPLGAAWFRPLASWSHAVAGRITPAGENPGVVREREPEPEPADDAPEAA